MMLVLGLGLGLAESPCKCQFWVLKCIFFVCNLYLFTIHSFRDYIFSLTYLLLLVATDSIFFYMLQSTQNKITQVLDKSSDVLTADIWTDRRMHSFWGVTVHGIVCSVNWRWSLTSTRHDLTLFLMTATMTIWNWHLGTWHSWIRLWSCSSHFIKRWVIYDVNNSNTIWVQQ